MQIDFHHAVTYIIARLADFTPDEASIISYSSQYVDDATNSGKITFSNKVKYRRISSAHRMVDPRNFFSLANQLAWTPFHFLPGNGGKKEKNNPEDSFISNLVCTTDSYVANEMVACCIADAEKPYALHRLGITLHVLADTFSHKGFAGVNHKINRVLKIDADGKVNCRRSLTDRIKSFFSLSISNTMPLGHGAALSCPDLPFLKWKYTNGFGQVIPRNNPPDYLMAVNRMFEVMVQFRAKNAEMKITRKIGNSDLEQIEKNIHEFTDEDGEKRHKQWIESIRKGQFSFTRNGDEKIDYINKGENSWKFQALGTKKHIEGRRDRFEYHDEFLSSNWKLFHDALQKHRLEVLHDVLPKFGICGA